MQHFILEPIMCLNQARLSRASLGRFLLPSSLGKIIEQTPVSKVMDLPGPAVCLMRWVRLPFVVRERHTRWAGSSPSLQTYCTLPVCTEAPIAIAVPHLLATPQPWPLPNTSHKKQRGRADVLFSKPHSVLGFKKKKLQQRGRDTL